jgi:hypothetical protein
MHNRCSRALRHTNQRQANRCRPVRGLFRRTRPGGQMAETRYRTADRACVKDPRARQRPRPKAGAATLTVCPSVQVVAPLSPMSVRPPLQRGNQPITYLHPKLDSMVLAGPQRTHPAFGIDPRGVVHPGQRPAAPAPRADPDLLIHVLLRPVRLKCHSAPPNLVRAENTAVCFAAFPGPPPSPFVHGAVKPDATDSHGSESRSNGLKQPVGFAVPGHVSPLHVSHESWRYVARN